MHCRICVHKQGSTDAHRYVCTCVHGVCVLCFIVVTVLRECVPGSALWAPCTKNLSVLPGGIWLSVWAAPQSAGPCAQPPALSTHTHSHTHSAHLTITHALHQPCLNRIMTHTHEHAHTHAQHQHPRKADLLLSWITDIHTALCSQNNLIPLTPSLRGLQQGLCLRQISLWLSLTHSRLKPTAGLLYSLSWVWASTLVRISVKEEEEEGGEGEITFSTGRCDYTWIIHRMWINSHCIYRFLITSALWDNEYA